MDTFNNPFKTKYVSSFGLATSVKNPPKIINKNGAIYEFNFNNQIGDTVYVRITEIIQFFQANLLDKFKNPIILVSGDMDTTVPDDVLTIYSYLDHPKLLKWYAQNYSGNYSHPKLNHLPIGLDYHTLHFASKNIPHEWGNVSTPYEQEKELETLCSTFKNIKDCNPDLAVTNFHHSTYGYPSRRQQFREPILKALQNKKCIIWLPKQQRLQFWRNCNTAAFVVCPFGNGLDTHRTWEVLILGRIPIIPKSGLNKVFEGLPIVEVEDNEWKDIDEIWLRTKYENIVNKWDTYDFKRLTLDYWLNMVNDVSHTLSSS